ncbi:hypothetical protein EVA_03200 [gut metagenome]|uniref:Uncharacterized protein n=1 Tax=gut metagenome TaxID=749906 RepID=J9D7F5_9ZZZZ
MGCHSRCRWGCPTDIVSLSTHRCRIGHHCPLRCQKTFRRSAVVG